eukprot:CAMPEP_0172403538 /NCGR_PEP_ID=MMETSP1061-20121228/59700_1 /TAXON_ID=37318 /ORGANISM="Pseudo-nitzschia pungens, Strain cf. pungens" /LENGTH=34 /DNA_ID= /DNA_START= /DNA_END= /DNA_ORIENTATION=
MTAGPSQVSVGYCRMVERRNSMKQIGEDGVPTTT